MSIFSRYARRVSKVLLICAPTDMCYSSTTANDCLLSDFRDSLVGRCLLSSLPRAKSLSAPECVQSASRFTMPLLAQRNQPGAAGSCADCTAGHQVHQGQLALHAAGQAEAAQHGFAGRLAKFAGQLTIGEQFSDGLGQLLW